MCIVYSGCEACNEWYHGDCINVTAEESQFIKHWYCHICRGELIINRILFGVCLIDSIVCPTFV